MWLRSVIIGIVLSLVWGLATWCFLQQKKERESILVPHGLYTGRYGALLGGALGMLCFGAVVYWVPVLRWWVALALGLMWLCGGRVSAYIERVCYARDRLEMLPGHAKRMVERHGHEQALRLWQSAVPRWWVNMMSIDWEREYKRRVGPILKSTDPTDPLFDGDRFMEARESRT